MPFFKLPDPSKKRREMLREAELELVHAENALEHYAAEVNKLKYRIRRLIRQLGLDESKAPSDA